MRRFSWPALLLLALACSQPERPAVPVPVIVISIDALRSDHLPAYGYPGVSTPAIDRLAADGIVFERAFVHYPLTLPSHVSLLSGLLPSQHGVRDNTGYPIRGDIVWLPQILQNRGYATGGAVSSSLLAASTGMGRGFDRYDGGEELQGRRPGSVTVDRALEWLGEVENDLFFLLVHLFEPHTPYAPAPPHDRSHAAYDGEIAAADAAVGRVLDDLSERDLYDRSLIVLTSDHGQGLGEHGERTHGVFLYRESLQVPLVLKLPGQDRAGTRIERPVQQIDLLPTILQFIGLQNENAANERPSLLADEPDESLIYAETYIPHLYYGASELQSLIGNRFQYIHSPEPELFDLVDDPRGLINLVDQEPELIELYRRRIDQLTLPPSPPEPIRTANRRQLAALGYLAGGALSVDEDLPAPSSLTEFIGLVQEAGETARQKNWEAARQNLLLAVELNPRAPFVWAQLARAEAALERPEEALEAMLEAVERTDGDSFRAVVAARMAMRANRDDLAEDLANRALISNPAEANGVLSNVALRRGDVKTAENHALAALDADAGWAGPAMTVLSVWAQASRPREALRLADEIEKRARNVPKGLNLLIGEAMVQLGRHEEAVEWVEREVRLYPERARPYGYLATLYGFLDRAEDAGETLDRLMDSVEGPDKYYTASRTLLQLGFPGEAIGVLQIGLEEYPEEARLRELERDLRRATASDEAPPD